MINKTKTAKLAAGLVGFAFAFALVAAPVASHAQTNSDLQAMINTLLAQIAALQGQVGGSTTSGHTFSTDLTIGSSGADVSALQQLLVSKGFLTMPAGVAMGTFGPLTQSAVAAWQAANGITPASGFFGPITRAKVNSMVVVTPPTTGGTTPPTTTGPLSGGAGDVTVTSRSSGTTDQVMESDSNTKVLGFEVQPEGSDVAITSVKVEFEHTDSTGSDRFNRYADSVSIMMDNKVIGSADAADFTKDANVYSRSIPVSGAVVRDNATARFYVAVSALGNVDSEDAGTTWNVGLGNIRFNDATGAILTDQHDGVDSNSGDITEDFSFETLSTAGNVTLTVNEDDSDVNDAHTVQVYDTSDTNDVPVLSFSLKAKDSDININSMTFNVTSSGAGVTEIASDFRLMADGDEVGTVTLNRDCTGAAEGFGSSTDPAVCVTVDDIDDDSVVINEGDTMNFELQADINDTGGAFTNGDSLSVTLNPDSTSISGTQDVDAEDQNGDALDTSMLNGSADSSSIAFSATGIMVSAGASDSSDVLENSGNVTTDDQGKFTINFDVTAFEDTAWVALSAASGSSTVAVGSAGAAAYVESPNNDDVVISTGTTTATLELASGQSGAADGNYAKINAGQTVHLVLTVYHDPATTGIFRAQLYGVNFATTKAVGTTQQLALPTSDYQSPSESVVN